LKIRLPFGPPFLVPTWIAGVSIALLVASSTIAIDRLIPASYANVPREEALLRAKDEPARTVPGPVMVDHVHRASCTDCGVIESMRQSERSTVDLRQGTYDTKVSRGVPAGASGNAVAASAAKAVNYEFTVRFRDGSTTIFNETNPRMWRLGSRVMVIGRAKTANQ
jgi:ribosomal protein S27AE